MTNNNESVIYSLVTDANRQKRQIKDFLKTNKINIVQIDPAPHDIIQSCKI